MAISKQEHDMAQSMMEQDESDARHLEHMITEHQEEDEVACTTAKLPCDDGDVDQDVKDTAQKILLTGNPIEYILDVFNDIHIGDRKLGEVLILSAGSSCVSNCQGIHPKLSGESGKGKSHSCKTMIHLMPEEYVLNTSLSSKAMFYHEMKPGSIIFSDDVDLSPDLESIIKRSTSEFHQGIEHKTVNIQRQAETLEIPPRIIWWLASVESELDMQTLNRQIGVDVDDSEDIDKLVTEHQLRAAGTGQPEYPETRDVQVCREIYRSVKEQFVSVVIPFYDHIEWRGGQNRRNLPMFLDMVKVFAIFNYQQRDTRVSDDGVQEVCATEDDFKSAVDLYMTRAAAQTSKLNAKEMAIVDFLASYGTATVETIAKYVDMPYSMTRRIICGRADRPNNTGLLGKVKGLSRQQITRELDGGNVRQTEYSMVDDYSLLGSYTEIVSIV